MNQPEHDLARRIARHLDYGVDQLEPGVRERLFTARQAALARYREKPELVHGFAWAGQAALRMTEDRYHGARHLFAVAAMVLALVGIAYWQSTSPINELAEIDTHLLGDELPVNAYLDNGFDSWLKRSPR